MDLDLEAVREMVDEHKDQLAEMILVYAVELQAERDQLRRGGRELGGIVTHLTELIKDAWKEGATDPVGALHMLGNHLAEILPDGGGLCVDEFDKTYRALEEHRAKVAELRARVDDLTGQVAARTADLDGATRAYERLRVDYLKAADQVAGRDALTAKVEAYAEHIWRSDNSAYRKAGRDLLEMIVAARDLGYPVDDGSQTNG